MNLSEFYIGLEFVCSGRRWRCTDVGSRVVVAIRVDEVTIGSVDPATGERGQRTVAGEEAERSGWFRGPPYSVAEAVFDEDDLEGCEPAP